MKDWTPWNWIAYGSLGVAAFLLAVNTAIRENLILYSWLPAFIKTYVLGYGPAIFFIIASIFFIIQKKKGEKVIEDGAAIPVVQALLTTMPPTPILIKPKEFYSDRNKSDLADALTDLSEILSTYGPNIMQKTHYVVDIWNLGSSRISQYDIANLITELNEVGKLANLFYQSIYNDKGLYKKYIVYSAELAQLLQMTSNTPNNQIPIFLKSINNFLNYLSTVELAEKYKDNNLIDSMIASSRPIFDDYLNSIRIFGGWFNEIHKRIITFRDYHLN